MSAVTQKSMGDNTAVFHYERARLNKLLAGATSYPVVIVTAGAGYGKTTAMLDYIMASKSSVAWLQLSDRDNVATRFWENYMNMISQINPPMMQDMYELGFPDTDDKISMYSSIIREHVQVKKRLLVLDDFHLIHDASVLRVIESSITFLPEQTSLVILSRSTPQLSLTNWQLQEKIFTIDEQDLRFTEDELAQFIRQQDVSIPSDELRVIGDDTGGWAFAINLIARSYDQAPGYHGYLRNAMRTNVYQLMEAEVNKCSKELKNFLVRLSLIDHLSVDLITQLAAGNHRLVEELEKQSAYVRSDINTHAYIIHPLFRDFLTKQQDTLSDEQKLETYAIAANWCNSYGFKIDAMGYYEKIGAYDAIVSIFFELPTQVPSSIAKYVAGIFERIPPEAFDTVDLLAVMHIRTVMSLGLWEETMKLLVYYEEKYVDLPLDSAFRNRTLGGVYYCWAIMRSLLCTMDHNYDFDTYYEKQDDCLTRSYIDPGPLANHPIGPWLSLVGSSRAGAPQDYIDTLSRAVASLSKCFNGALYGADAVAQAELYFYQGNMQAAEPYLVQGLERARERNQYDLVHRALFYMMRIAAVQGDFAKAESAREQMVELLEQPHYTSRYVTYEIGMGWYYSFLGLPDMVPEWLSEGFVPYGHPYFIENFGNTVRTRYYMLTKNYSPLLAYLSDDRHDDSVLYGRIELLALRACVYYKLKNRKAAFASLAEAKAQAEPNNLLLPFIELGKDMRTLSAAAIKEPSCDIEVEWLETINRRSAAYAKRQAHIASRYRQEYQLGTEVVFSTRELEVLMDLSQGLSRTEIAAVRGLSINTVKTVISNTYNKLEVDSLADLIRVAVQLNLI